MASDGHINSSKISKRSHHPPWLIKVML